MKDTNITNEFRSTDGQTFKELHSVNPRPIDIKLVKPLRPGDTVGICSTSSPTTATSLDNIRSYFMSIGNPVRIAPHTLDSNGYMAGDPRTRASDFHELVSDSEIKMIMTATGGHSAIQMLPYLDFDLIRSNPKIICGLSDPTSILNAITYRAGVPTFHGPNGYNFGCTVPTEFSEKNWRQLVTGAAPTVLEYPVRDRMKVLRHGDVVEGAVYGGNLGVFCSLIGSPYFPDMTGKILFIEEAFQDYCQIDTWICQLKLCGVFNRIKGLVVGENLECRDSSDANERYDELLLRNLSEFTFPIVYDVPLGHTDDKITIPLGLIGRIDSSRRQLSLIESPFCRDGLIRADRKVLRE